LCSGKFILTLCIIKWPMHILKHEDSSIFHFNREVQDEKQSYQDWQIESWQSH
jgi:hypothetical protein